MSLKNLLVVGDRFEKFAGNDGVISFSAAESMLSQDKLADHNIRLQLGQGLSAGRVERLINLAKRLKQPWLLNFTSLDKAGRRHAHKHDPRNSMISMPRRTGPNSFHLDVLLDEHCAEMSDHMTGQHIQGMVVLEATRQAFLAVTEEFFLQDAPESSYFVINEMNVEYSRFVFPLPMSILYEILQHQAGRTQRFHVRMSLIQTEQVCCVMNTRFACYPDSFIATKEEALAKAAIDAELNAEFVHEKLA